MRVLFLIESECLPPVRAIRSVPYGKRHLVKLAGQSIFADSDPGMVEQAGVLYSALASRDCLAADQLCSPHVEEAVLEAEAPVKVVLFHYNPDRKG